MAVLRDYQCQNRDCGNIFESIEAWCPVCGCQSFPVILKPPGIITSQSATTRYEDDFTFNVAQNAGKNPNKVIDIAGRELLGDHDPRPTPQVREIASNMWNEQANFQNLNSLGAKIANMENMRADMGPRGIAKPDPLGKGKVNIAGKDVRIKDLIGGSP